MKDAHTPNSKTPYKSSQNRVTFKQNRPVLLTVIVLAMIIALCVSFGACGKSGNGSETIAPTGLPATEAVVINTEQPGEDRTGEPAGTELPTSVPATDVPATDVPATEVPTQEITELPATDVPTEAPTELPTDVPTEVPTPVPTEVPTPTPTERPTATPTKKPDPTPTKAPTATPPKPTSTPSKPTPTDPPATEQPDVTVKGIVLPADNSYSRELALSLITIGSFDKSKEGLAANMTNAGFTVVKQGNYDKEKTDPSHTAAYTLGKGTILRNGEKRNVFLLIVRGTEYGEWYSNIDFAPSHSDLTLYAENFQAAAQDIYDSVSKTVLADKKALLLISGHSRGGAVSNLLGVMFNAVRDTELNYIYAFASPTTLHTPSDGSDTLDVYADNIYNVINRYDPFPELPPKEMGFYRPGNDVILEGNSAPWSTWKNLKSSLIKISGTISSYYNDRHSLTQAGLSEDGMTMYELLKQIIDLLMNTDITDTSDTMALMQSILGSDTYRMISSISRQSDLYPVSQMLSLTTLLFSYDQYVALGENHKPETYIELLKA